MGIAVGVPYGGTGAPGMAQGLPLGVPPPMARPAPALMAPQGNMHVRIAEPVAPVVAAAPAAPPREGAERVAAPAEAAPPPQPVFVAHAQSTLDIREAEAQVAAAAEERKQAAERDALASQLALKAASKILATKAKRRAKDGA